MKLLLKAALICGLSFVQQSPATFAQSGPATTAPFQQWRIGHPYKEASPYCGTKEFWKKKDETLPDGTKATRDVVVSKERVCRDSLGRGWSRIEFPNITVSGVPSNLVVEIYDPIEGVLYYVDSVHRTARRMTPANPLRLSESASSIEPCPPGFSLQVQLLGTQLLEGVLAEGTRCKKPGEIEGLEYWFSHELDEQILLNHGALHVRLTDIDRSEPDPSLFRVPSDYKIEDATDPLVR
jgi:hypothetical protein